MKPPTTSSLHRSVTEPLRVGLTWNQRWRGPDGGLIACWERGREMRSEKSVYPAVSDADGDNLAKPEPAFIPADRGELFVLPWRGGVSEKLKVEFKSGTLQYLAMWQGLRGEDLDIDTGGETVLTCSRTGQRVAFSRESPPDPDRGIGDGA